MTTKKEVYAAYGIERRPAALESALSELKAKDAEIARLQAQVDALADALQAMLEGSFYIESARIALAAVGR